MKNKLIGLIIATSVVVGFLCSCSKEYEYLYSVSFGPCSNARTCTSDWYNLPASSSDYGIINAYVDWGSDVWSPLPATLTSANLPPLTIDYTIDKKNDMIKFNLFFQNGDPISLNGTFSQDIKVIMTN